jgi:hypothetical protein
MKYYFLFSFFIVLLFSSCKRSNDLDISKEYETLLFRFNGKYKIISSVADQAIDLNLDGGASVDLKEEFIHFENNFLEIKIINHSNKHVFMEFWPEPYFGGLAGASPTTYDPNVTVAYAQQGVTRLFQFSSDLKKILLDPEDVSTDLNRYTRPDSVNIKTGDNIEIIKTKKFYTSSGWKEVRVATLYERYT